jgi:hypothetical protein
LLIQHNPLVLENTQRWIPWSGHVVCVGLATRDTILAVPRHPAADELVLATDVAIAGGGPAATAAVTLARLGIETAFVGAVGDDETGEFIRAGLESEGVDVSEVAIVPGRRSPGSAINVGPGTRAIAAFRGDIGRPRLSERAEGLCRDAARVHVDQTGYGSVPDGVRLSTDAGIAIDHLDVAGVALYGPTQPALECDFGSAEAALATGAQLVVVTEGAHGCTAYTAAGAVEALFVREQPHAAALAFRKASRGPVVPGARRALGHSRNSGGRMTHCIAAISELSNAVAARV